MEVRLLKDGSDGGRQAISQPPVLGLSPWSTVWKLLTQMTPRASRLYRITAGPWPEDPPYLLLLSAG